MQLEIPHPDRFVPPEIYMLLQKILYGIPRPKDMANMSSQQLMDYILLEIKKYSTAQGIPIFMNGRDFLIYNGEVQVDLPRRYLRYLLWWVCQRFGIEDKVFGYHLYKRAYDILN